MNVTIATYPVTGNTVLIFHADAFSLHGEDVKALLRNVDELPIRPLACFVLEGVTLESMDVEDAMSCLKHIIENKKALGKRTEPGDTIGVTVQTNA